MRIPAAARVCGDRYRLASFGLSGFAVYSALRGANLCYDDCLRDFDRVQEFFEKIIEFETEMFDTVARKGFHGIEFCDDWGPRKTSRLTLSLWRVLFKHFYEEQIKRAKGRAPRLVQRFWRRRRVFGDLKELGVGVVRVETPESIEVSPISDDTATNCALPRVDTVLSRAIPIVVRAAASLRECLGVLTGGFIATIGDNVPQNQIRQIYSVVKQFRNA